MAAIRASPEACHPRAGGNLVQLSETPAYAGVTVFPDKKPVFSGMTDFLAETPAYAGVTVFLGKIPAFAGMTLAAAGRTKKQVLLVPH